MSQDQGRVMGKCPQAWQKARGVKLQRARLEARLEAVAADRHAGAF